MKHPTNAIDFVTFMEAVWEMRSTPTDSGGITLFVSPLYDRYHDAIQSARLFGARRTGGSRIADENAHVYRFPNDTNSVIIAYGGNACKLSSRRFGPRAPRS